MRNPSVSRTFDIYAPWAWEVEPVYGCNLRCGHCAARLLEHEPRQMSLETWANIMHIAQAVKPNTRVELAMCGEPTLHDELPLLLWMGRKICPQAQFKIITNGTMLTSGRWTYKELFKAGANIIYVDMYAPRERHIELAEESGYLWYEYLDAPDSAPSAWSYHGPNFKFIVLMENPANWPSSRKGLGRLGTWLNHLDWGAAAEFGLAPVTEPVEKVCLQPFRYAAVRWTGEYLLCCQDFMGETAGTMGSVDRGLEGFVSYWFGRKMQETRQALRAGHRGSVPECSRCDVAFNVRPAKHPWPDEKLLQFWEDGEMKDMLRDHG